MTSVFPTSLETRSDSSEAFDIGPLSWVMAEVREAITSAGRLVLDAVTQEPEEAATTVLQAKSYLHQAHGALQIVDIDGVSLVAETIEDTLERIQSAQLELNPHSASFINDALNAILAYLESLLSGAPHQPVRLFPYYRALLELRGAERIHPADLFFPSLSVQDSIPELELNVATSNVNYAVARPIFERLLLSVLTSKDAAAQLIAVKSMHDVITQIERAQTNKQSKAFWLVMRGFAEVVAQGAVENSQYVKQIFARVNLQIRRLVDGATTIPERLLRDALFFIAQVDKPSPFVAQIRKAYQLDSQVPVNYDQKSFEQIAPGVLSTVKEHLSAAKNLWGRIANGDLKLSEKFSQKMSELAESGDQLNSPPLSKLLRELSGIARHATRAGDIRVLGLEVATSLLFVESAFDQISHLPAHFAERADEISARLLSLVSGEALPEQAAWMGEISREAQQRQTMATLVGELQTSMRQVEKNLDEFFRDTNNKEALTSVPAALYQVAGALAILDQDDAMLAVEHTRNLVKNFIVDDEQEENPNRAAEFNNVAQNVGALTFFIETLQSQPDAAKKKFVFDPAIKLLRSNLLEKPAEKGLLPSGVLEQRNPLNTTDGAQTATSAPEFVTAEQELRERQTESARLATSLAATPDDLDLQAQLKTNLESQRSVAALLDDAEASAQASAAIQKLAENDSASQATAVKDIVAANEVVPNPADTAHVVAIPESEDAIDAELLEIFLSEAEEVLAFVAETIPASKTEPSNLEHMTSLRRSFHTLKGSGRMVGLNVFGEAAWSVEQLMNLWLSEAREGTERLYRVLELASSELADWVEDLKLFGSSGKNGHTIIAAADSLRNDEAEPDFSALEVSAPEALADAVAVTSGDFDVELPQFDFAPNEVSDPVAITLEVPNELSEAADEFAAPLELLPEFAFTSEDVVAEEAPLVDATESVPELMTDLGFETLDEQLAITEPILLDAVLEDIALDAGMEVPATLSLMDESESIVATEVVDDAEHDVADDVVDAFDPVPEVLATAQIIDFPEQASDPKFDDNVKLIGDLEISLPLHTIYMAETDEIVRYLTQDFSEWRHEPTRAVSKHAVHATHSLAGSSGTVGLKSLRELALMIEAVLQRLERHPVNLLTSEFDILDNSLNKAKHMLQMFGASELAGPAPDEIGVLEQMLQAVIERSNEGEDEEFIASTNEVVELDDGLADALVEVQDDSVSAPVAELATMGDFNLELPAEEIQPVPADTAVANVEVNFEASTAENTEVATQVDTEPRSEFAFPFEQGYVAPEELINPIPAFDPVFALEVNDVDTTSTNFIEPVQQFDADITQVSDTPIQDPQDPIETLDFAQDLSAPLVETSFEEVAEVPPVDSTDSAPYESDLEVTLEPASEFPSAQDVSQDVIQEAPIAPTAPAFESELALQVRPLAATPAPVSADHALDIAPAGGEHRVKDDLDADLLPVFLEEGADLLPMVGQLLRTWLEQPDDRNAPQSILRLMHTIKGSARMAGAMELGQHTHDLETRIETLMHTGGAIRLSLIEDLLARHDYSMQMFDRLQNPNLAAPIPVDSFNTAINGAPSFEQDLEQFQNQTAFQNEPAANVAEVNQGPVELTPLMPIAPSAAGAAALPTFRPAAAAPTTATIAPLVRVRADILDRLVNQAGEVSISRSRLENEVGTLRSSLTELTENVSRLRDQLREVEIQAETQITSRMALSGDREFDPLEFDRFTRLQELTRMMAESVSDVATVQTNLNRTLEGASNDLHTQARLTRELQQDLMRVRMIPFASVSERLYRVTRQTAKELDKRVNLDIRGTSVEMDRSVLEKMTGPFEHLLRNAIVHGIESREQRVANGKAEIGELLIEIRQEGNEVVIRFQDDGQGINVNRVREKARGIGLLTNDAQVSDAEAANLIFEPGFSTASEVTELAGRGVGMDVVRSEATSLGGRVDVQTELGKGAQFTIRLPLTLAVTQVVILSSGGKTYAVPSVLVEQVQRLRSATLANAYNDGAIQWQGSRVPMYFLSGLLGDSEATPVMQHSSPMLIMKSGTDRVAIHVDDILGNREVVVKNIGPQLARMAGIAGATVLGSGDIVLILNPVPLAQRFEQEKLRHPQLPEVSGGVDQDLGAVAESAQQDNQAATSEPIQGLRTHNIVMVVDDSLTVRRVSQRMLLREGYQVVLAKDGIDALEQLQTVTPDVMLVDIEMPRMDGFDLTRNVRSDARTAGIPIIMITSRTADKHRNYAQELGVNGYFGKPYPEAELLEAIAGFLGKVATD
jgi:chemosensory pili system protein ChpA (sensor histidine kinase/response regulator)